MFSQLFISWFYIIDDFIFPQRKTTLYVGKKDNSTHLDHAVRGTLVLLFHVLLLSIFREKNPLADQSCSTTTHRYIYCLVMTIHYVLTLWWHLNGWIWFGDAGVALAHGVHCTDLELVEA